MHHDAHITQARPAVTNTEHKPPVGIRWVSFFEKPFPPDKHLIKIFLSLSSGSHFTANYAAIKFNRHPLYFNVSHVMNVLFIYGGHTHIYAHNFSPIVMGQLNYVHPSDSL